MSGIRISLQRPEVRHDLRAERVHVEVARRSTSPPSRGGGCRPKVPDAVREGIEAGLGRHGGTHSTHCINCQRPLISLWYC
jgi:hypothetical protein